MEKRSVERKLIRPVIGEKLLILSKSPHNPRGILWASRDIIYGLTVCLFTLIALLLSFKYCSESGS